VDYFVRFAQASVFYVLLPTIILCVWLKLRVIKRVCYRYPLATTLESAHFTSSHPRNKIFFLLRFFTLLGLAILIAKPELVDPRSKIMVEGIDIVLVLDISGSMVIPHHTGDSRSRIAVAKQEAIRFIEKRTNDSIGIVVFGNDALSRCPLTADKMVLKEIVRSLEIGLVNPDGTLLATSMLTAINRLKRSKAKSKIMILLTDGEPTENDIDPRVPVQAAKQLGIKIYTIGIGSDEAILVNHPLYGKIPIKTTLNKKLLTMIANQTGGKFFEARKANDMREIYDTIDQLEKTEIETPLFSRTYDWFMPLVWLLLAMVGFEVLMTTFVWFGL